ncbi:MAG TPA: metallophosphoesterase [Anaerolineae bacterium]|nr:metallophosphoesterase [Anaerolineae bacterium]
MKVLAVSDKVLNRLYRGGIAHELGPIDLVVGCGDLPYYYLKFLASALDTRVFFVHGNHDSGAQYTYDGQQLKQIPGGFDLHGRFAWERKVLFAGLEGSMWYRPNAAYMYHESQMFWEVMRLVPRLMWNRARYGRALDVLVTHSPPFGIHDEADVAHTGFKAFLMLMRRFRPKYLLHGHIHTHRPDVTWVTQYYGTRIINVYPYRVLDLEAPPAVQAVVGKRVG